MYNGVDPCGRLLYSIFVIIYVVSRRSHDPSRRGEPHTTTWPCWNGRKSKPRLPFCGRLGLGFAVSFYSLLATHPPSSTNHHHLYYLSLSYSWKLREFLEHSSIRERKEKEWKESKGKKISRKEGLNQVATRGLIVGIELHIWFPC